MASSCATPPRELAAEVAAWDILSALFGDEPGGAPRGSASDRHRRRAKTRAWLRDQAGRVGVPEETLRGARAATTFAAAGSAVKATAAAAANRDPRLATLTAQIGVGGAGAALAAAQLDLWRGSPAEKYVPEETLALYGLAAGEVAPPHPLVPAEDWRRCFGTHLGVAHPPTASAARVVEGYLDAVEKGAAAFPTAPGREAIDPDVARLKDLCFNLLVLASSGGAPEGVSTASAFHPLTYCASDLANVALTWHVHAALRAVGALPETKETSKLADALHVAFAEQLLRAGGGGRGVGGGEGRDARMVEWAAFVAMHVEDDGARRDAVRGILHRRCADWCDDAEKIAFLRRRLGVRARGWTRPRDTGSSPTGGSSSERERRERARRRRDDTRSSRVFTDRELRRLRESRRREFRFVSLLSVAPVCSARPSPPEPSLPDVRRAQSLKSSTDTVLLL